MDRLLEAALSRELGTAWVELTAIIKLTFGP